MGYWKSLARDVILTVMRGALAEGLPRAAMIQRVDNAYPFGPRANYPYQAWLEVRRDLLFDGQPVPSAHRARSPSEADKMRAADAPGLFDEVPP